jgi:hypothetical protein
MPPPFLVDIPFGQIINTIIALGVPGGAIWYVRDRKKDKAAAQITETQADVAESTRDVDISAKGLEFVGRAIEMERQSFENERASLLRQVEDCTKSLKQIQEAYKLETERMHQHMLECVRRTQQALTEADMLRGQVTTIGAQVATRPIPIIVESGRAANDLGDSDQSGS